MQYTTNGKRIKPDEQISRTWSGGTTQEIFVYPPEASFTEKNYAFWVGIATIERSVEYSFLPGYQRIHIPIKGSGIRLHFREPLETVALATFDHYLFDGGRPLYAELVHERVIAFNLIFRSDVRANAKILRLDERPTSVEAVYGRNGTEMRSVRVVYAITGSTAIRTAADHEILLQEEDAFVFGPREANVPVAEELLLRSGDLLAEVVVVDITFARDS